jgi:Tfp pilus assembly protein FimV
MDSDGPRLGHAILGFRRSAVRSLLADRDKMLQFIAKGRRDAEAKVLDLTQELEAARGNLAQKDAAIAELQHQVDEMSQLVVQLEETNREVATTRSGAFIGEELDSMLNAAESSAARIFDGVRSITERELQNAERAWRDVQDEVTRLASWREQLDPVVGSLRSQLDETVIHLEDAPRRMRDIIEPIAKAMATITQDLERLAHVSKPPLVLAPSHDRSVGNPRSGDPSGMPYPRVSRR